MLDFFRNISFLSYRNVIDDGQYVNYQLVNYLGEFLKEKEQCTKYYRIAPESIPYGTLFTPYDVAKFIHTTFMLLDNSDHFVILNDRYFVDDNIDNEFTSMWTEAEALMWNYYDRDMFLGVHGKKDKFYLVATPNYNPSTSELSHFDLSKKDLLSVDRATKVLLQRAALDFDSSNRFPKYYSAFADLYLFTCNGCGANSLFTKRCLKKAVNEAVQYSCNCGNAFDFYKAGRYFTANQFQERSVESRSIFITDVLRHLFSEGSPFPIIDLD